MSDCSAHAFDVPSPRSHLWAGEYDAVAQEGGGVRYEPRRPAAAGPVRLVLDGAAALHGVDVADVACVVIDGARFVRDGARDWDDVEMD